MPEISSIGKPKYEGQKRFLIKSEKPNYSTGIECFKCEFYGKDLQYEIENPSEGMPNCAYDNLYHFDKAQNLSIEDRCQSCVKADVYLKGNIISPQHHFLRHLNHRRERPFDPTRLL